MYRSQQFCQVNTPLLGIRSDRPWVVVRNRKRNYWVHPSLSPRRYPPRKSLTLLGILGSRAEIRQLYWNVN